MKIKIVLLGDMGVGKTSFITKYITGQFKLDNSSTLGASFFTHKMKINEEEHLLEIWDTAGQERYRSLAPMYFRGADVAFIFFDLSKLYSYFSVEYWKKELLSYGPPNIIQIVVGNKLDLINIDKLESKYKNHFLISTKENIDLDRLVKTGIIEAIKLKKKRLEQKKIEEDRIKESLYLKNNSGLKKYSCCR